MLDHGCLADGPRRHLRQPHTAKRGQRQFQPLPLVTKQMMIGKRDILKIHLNMRGAAQPHHWLITANLEPGHALLDQKG